MKRVFGVHLTLLFILLLVCGLISTTALAAQSTYTGSDNGKTITVKTGDTFIVKLDENPTTGYSWNLTAGTGLTVIRDQYTPNSTGLVGSGGYHTWTIKAVNNGTYKISGIYKRPWEPATNSDRRFTLTVKASGNGTGSTSPFAISFPEFKSMIDLFDFKPKNTTFAGFGDMFKHFPQLSLNHN
jgi:inhibitor of cysteine peptidase